jgi:hypothetical protein
MTSNDELIRSSDQEDATAAFCATCGHSEFVHADNGNRPCVFSVCDCNRFIVGATLDLSAQVLPS